MHALDRVLAAALLCILCAACAGDKETGGEPEAPANVNKPPDETEIATVTLTEAAAQRLGITTTPTERKPMPRRRTFGGVVEVPLGSALTVAAPLAGALELPSGKTLPFPGSRVQAGQAVFILNPLLSPDRAVPTPAERAQVANVTATLAAARAMAEGDVDKAKTEVEAARIAMRRAEQLLRDRAGSQRAVDEARATQSIAQANLEAANSRLKTLQDLKLDSDTKSVEPIPILAPGTGVIRSLSVAPGVMTPAGTQLFEVVSLETLWIRLPVYVGLVDQIDADAEAIVTALNGTAHSNDRSLKNSGGELRRARPIVAPPSADPVSSTADLIYEIDNADGALRPGERIGLSIALRGEAESLVVPSAAVLYDIYGGTWVYALVGERTYRRERVQVRHVVDGLAVLASGPKPGTEIIVEGCAEVFGTEFGPGK